MTGRPVHLLTAAAFAAAASLLSVSSASACFSGCGYGYAAPVYSAPVAYSVSYAAPVSYGGGCANPVRWRLRLRRLRGPSYVVNQGPAYDAAGDRHARAVLSATAARYPYVGGGYGGGYGGYGGGYGWLRLRRSTAIAAWVIAAWAIVAAWVIAAATAIAAA